VVAGDGGVVEGDVGVGGAAERGGVAALETHAPRHVAGAADLEKRIGGGVVVWQAGFLSCCGAVGRRVSDHGSEPAGRAKGGVGGQAAAGSTVSSIAETEAAGTVTVPAAASLLWRTVIGSRAADMISNSGSAAIV